MDILLRTTLQAVRSGEMGVDEACDRLAGWSHESVPFATIDHHRALRSGFPEVVYCAGKTPAQAAAIARRVWERSGRMLATRAGGEHARGVPPVGLRDRPCHGARDHLLCRAGADGVILGCTEITMPIDQADPDVPVLDTDGSHAEVVTSFATATGP